MPATFHRFASLYDLNPGAANPFPGLLCQQRSAHERPETLQDEEDPDCPAPHSQEHASRAEAGGGRNLQRTVSGCIRGRWRLHREEGI